VMRLTFNFVAYFHRLAGELRLPGTRRSRPDSGRDNARDNLVHKPERFRYLKLR